MPVEHSPIIPLLAGLSDQQRAISLGVGALVKRQQQFGHWTGDFVVLTVDRQQVELLPPLVITAAMAQSMGISRILSRHHPEVCALLYTDPQEAVWCIRLTGPGLPVIQEDWFQTYAKLAVLV